MKQRLKHQILLWGLSLILILAGFSFSTPVSAETLAAAPAGTALEVFRTAYDNRYTWDSQFPGYTAAVELKQDAETYQGQIRINRDLSIEITGIEDDDAYQSLLGQLKMSITHRQSVPFEVSHQQHTFSFGPRGGGGTVEIDQQGGDTPSFYQVQDRKIAQVNRIMGSVSVTVDLLDSEETPAGYLGTRSRAFFKDSQTGKVFSKIEFEDTYHKIGSYYIPTHQTIRPLDSDEENTTEINLTDIQLLS